MQRIVILFSLVLLISLSGCGSSDLSLINEVKRFEPEWMNLSEKVTFMDRYLRITEKRYEADLKQVDPLISGTSSQAYQLKNQYTSMMNDRKLIADDFEKRKGEFTKAVSEFNDWQNKLMKNKLGLEKAKVEFTTFQQRHTQLTEAISEQQNGLIKNIEKHNSLMRRLTRELKIYSNYDIRYE